MLVFIDGFDHYPTADLALKWSIVTGSPTISASGGRFSSGALSSIYGNFLTRPIVQGASWVVGFAFKIPAAPPSGKHANLCAFLDGTSYQVELTVNDDLTVEIRKNGVSIDASFRSSLTLSVGVWYYAEWKVTISNSIAASSCKVNVSGTTWITGATSASTRSTANSYATRFVLGNDSGPTNSANPGAILIDDFYLCDQSGSLNNDILGDRRVETLYPSGAGTTTGFSHTGAASNWQAVSESPQDGDTSYVSGSVVTTKDTYAIGNLSSSALNVSGVQVNVIGRKDDAGSRLVAPVVRSGGTDYLGADFGLADSYTMFRDIRETDPATGVAWTNSGVNAIEAGVEITG